MSKTILILSIIMLISACQSTLKVVDAPLQQQTTLENGQGVVAVEVINNTPHLAPRHQNWQNVIVVRLDNAKQRKQTAIAHAREEAKRKKVSFDPDEVEWQRDYYRLTANPQGTISSQVFVGAIPEGEYAIAFLYSYYFDGNLESWLAMPVYRQAGVFNVEAFALTDLGTLVFQPLLNIEDPSFWQNKSKKRAYVTRIMSNTDLAPFVKQHHPNLVSKLQFSHINSWQHDPYAPLREELSNLSMHNAYGELATSLQHSKNNILAARFGLLYMVNENGDLVTDSLPTISQLTSSTMFKNTLLVGSERGMLFSKSTDGKWQENHPVSAKEAFVWLGSSGQFGYAITSSEKRHTIYRFNDVVSEWQNIGYLDKKDDKTHLRENGGLFAFFDEKGNIRVINDKIIYLHDQTLNSWQSKPHQKYKRFAQLKTGELIAVEVSQWSGHGDQVISIDYGKSWQNVDRTLQVGGDPKIYANLPSILPNKQVASIGRYKKSMYSKSKLRIITTDLSTTNDQEQWTPHGYVLPNCQTKLSELTQGSTLFFLCDQGQIVSTSDLGYNWEVKVDIDIARMQEQFDALATQLEQEEKIENRE
ncbi:hypothetical protein J8M21_24775 [Pseudoalteromonas luteoviolacea]|uniref:hypothetical protein n=1 Tax=Pseudoalteromonas luteoviolacea TaxID=43657 RepID=UPI001B3A29AE|nr:hypothetical protein [Pseudoalteromonas luteoviolacea]MBQ4880418.1 hypothetical protein [Pseudoalteromonas luteoviolacea]MBQ4909479.1 hypothetical protein [Pseudoalteromonas luteoviolacea]